MDWMQRMNDALAYLEAHLEGEADIAQAARLAGCSPYHFQRVFTYMAGVPLMEYLRRRRLTQAAFALQQTQDKVIDIALRAGYDSPTAFTRAFHALHGITPSQARQPGRRFTSFAPISFQISIKGVQAMNYQIQEMGAFRVVGAKMTTYTENNQSHTDIPRFWGQSHQDATIPRLLPLMQGEPQGLLGICAGDWQTLGEFDYYIAVASDMPVPEGMHEYTVPAGTWAIFEARGPLPSALQEAQHRVMTEWLPGSGYEYADAPDIEVYTAGDQASPEYLSYVWLPVRVKD